MVFLDELSVVFKAKFLTDLMFRLKPRYQHVVCTSRQRFGIHSLVRCDNIRHHFALGLVSRLGLEY